MASVATARAQAEYAEYSGTVRWIILFAVMLGTLMQVIDTSIVNVAIPTMMGNLGATIDQIGWVSTGYIISNVILLPLTGWLSTTFGRKRYLGWSIVLFTAASFLCGTSRTLNQLVFFRVVQGAGGAALLSTAQATMMEIFPPQQLGVVQAIYGVGVLVGPTVGPTLGGWITDSYSWPWIFFINLPVGILAATLTFIFVHDSVHQKRGSLRVDFVGIMLLAIGLGCLQTVLERGNREDWFESTYITTLAVIAGIGLISFIAWELHTPHPAVNLRVLRNRGLAAGSIIAALLGFGLYGGVFVLPIFLQDVRRYTAEQSGWILFPGGIATACVMPFVGRMVSRVAPRILTGVGMVVFVLAMFLLRTITMDTGPAQLFWPLVIRGAAMGFLFVPLTLATLLGLKGREIAEGTGLFNLSRQLGGSIGIAVLSTFLDHRIVFHTEVLSEHITVYNPGVRLMLRQLVAGMMAHGSPASVARQQAVAMLSRIVHGQASILAFEDVFAFIGYVFMIALPLLLLFKRGMPEGMGRAQAVVD